ncbi:hypothetical protein DERP_003513 [Dermatophagoides pteronyssinus]|uniref:Uncharacterized protein n=1 Tax=Dermatophagoides pteronyssinus TaxID=6956 RepID=A0ABQ8JLK4_DERPT|nr:hypothetical protein DERP_003513 [Dermatophagoides pteronyssinus]
MQPETSFVISQICRYYSKDYILIRKTKYDNVVDDDDVFAKTKKKRQILLLFKKQGVLLR